MKTSFQIFFSLGTAFSGGCGHLSRGALIPCSVAAEHQVSLTHISFLILFRGNYIWFDSSSTPFTCMIETCQTPLFAMYFLVQILTWI